jgi:hypothetical protein
MIDVLTIDQKKEIALGRDRNKALAVLMPCIGAIGEIGVVSVQEKRSVALVSQSPRFELHFITDDVFAQDGEPIFYFRVIWRGRRVMTGNLFTSNRHPFGLHLRPLKGYPHPFNWKRSYDVRQWQAELFDDFPFAPGWDQPRSEASLFLEKISGLIRPASRG